MQQLVTAAIAGDAKVWLYPLESPTAREPHVVFSQDYLMGVVAERLRAEGQPLPVPPEETDAWMEHNIPPLVKKALAVLGAHPGYAVLAGAKRSVWVLGAKIRLAGGKQVKTQRVQVKRSI